MTQYQSSNHTASGNDMTGGDQNVAEGTFLDHFLIKTMKF